MNSALMFSKASDQWETPQAFFDALDAEFHFDWDVAANERNAKCGHYFGGDALDALTARWHEFVLGPCFCNPPYSQCAEFVAKAAEEATHGVTTVMLIPSRTDTKYWHRYIWNGLSHLPNPGIEIRFLKGRLKFGDGKNSAPFPSVLVIFRPIAS